VLVGKGQPARGSVELRVNSTPNQPITSKTKSLFGFASFSPISYELASYGPVKVRALPND